MSNITVKYQIGRYPIGSSNSDFLSQFYGPFSFKSMDEAIDWIVGMCDIHDCSLVYRFACKNMQIAMNKNKIIYFIIEKSKPIYHSPLAPKI